MMDVMKCCANLHNVIFKALDVDESMAEKRIVCNDPSAEDSSI